MEIVISGRHTEVPERFRRLAEEKLVKVGQLAPRAHRTDVELSHEKNPRQAQTCEKVEITVRGKGPVIRAEASAEDPAAALDLALGKLMQRLRRHRDRRKVHHGRQTPPTLRVAEVTPRAAVAERAPSAALTGVDVVEGGLDDDGVDGPVLDGAELDSAALDGSMLDGSVLDDSVLQGAQGEPPVVIRAKDHEASPMSLEQALYEMELVGHDFYLFVEADTLRPSVVYRRRGWSYGVIRLTVT